jgi:hypothetical protein
VGPLLHSVFWGGYPRHYLRDAIVLEILSKELISHLFHAAGPISSRSVISDTVLTEAAEDWLKNALNLGTGLLAWLKNGEELDQCHQRFP